MGNSTWRKEKERRSRPSTQTHHHQIQIHNNNHFQYNPLCILKTIASRLQKPHLAEPTREYLQERKDKLELAANLNKIQVVNTAGALADQPGFYCKTCDCLLKSSDAYLDHVNGRRHQKKMGYSMRVQRSTIDEVQKRLQIVKESKPQDYNYEERVKELEQEEISSKEEKRNRKKRKKEEESEEFEVSDEMKEMGFDFGGFKSKK